MINLSWNSQSFVGAARLMQRERVLLIVCFADLIQQLRVSFICMLCKIERNRQQRRNVWVRRVLEQCLHMVVHRGMSTFHVRSCICLPAHRPLLNWVPAFPVGRQAICKRVHLKRVRNTTRLFEDNSSDSSCLVAYQLVQVTGRSNCQNAAFWLEFAGLVQNS